MRNSPLEVTPGPSYLLHPDNKRIQYGGGFRIIKPQQLHVTNKQPSKKQDKSSVQIEESRIKDQEQLKPDPIQNFKSPTILPAPTYNYNYYHDGRDFTNFFGLDDAKYHICFNHNQNCKICHMCQPQLHTSINNCRICNGGQIKTVKYQKKNSNKERSVMAYKNSQSKESTPKQLKLEKQIVVIQKQQTNKTPKAQESHSKQLNSLPPSDFNQQDLQKQEQPLPPKNASVSQQMQYQQKYNDYLLRKRDLYYLAILKKLVEKVDFQRYQCTSPNQERIHAHWFGLYRPRVMQTSAGKVKYQDSSHPGYEFLKAFIFIYLSQGKYKERQNYQMNAQTFLNELQQLLIETEKSQPTKALQKLNAQAYRKILNGKIIKQKLGEFLMRLKFVPMAFGISHIPERLLKLPMQLGFQNYKHIFTMNPQSLSQSTLIDKKYKQQQEKLQKKYSKKDRTYEQFNFKPVFPQIQQLQHVPRETLNIVKTPGKKLTIREKKLLADLMQKQIQQRANLNYKFKAKDIPKQVMDRSLYNKLLDEQALRSTKNRQQSAKKLIQSQNPFSFYYRDQHKQKPIEEFKKFQTFKANEVPKHVNQPRYQKMIEQKEKLRKQHLQVRQNELLKLSSFPATMSYLQQYPKMKQKKLDELPYKFKPQISKQVPNFQRLHQKNINQLQQKKQLNKTLTKPQEFNLSKGNKRIIEDNPPRPLSSKKSLTVSLSQPKQYMSKSTLKFDALVQKRRRQVEEKERKQTEKKKKMQSNPSELKHHELLRSRIYQNVRDHEQSSGGNFVIPQDGWNSNKKQEMLSKVYEERPLLLDRQKVRKDRWSKSINYQRLKKVSLQLILFQQYLLY